MSKCRYCGWEYDLITAKKCRDCDGDRRNRRNCSACGETGCEHTCMANQALNSFREGMRKAAAEDEVGWLIETTADGPTQYWSEEGFCQIASHGERFSTEAAAKEQAAKLQTPTRVSDHLWPGVPYTPTVGGDDVETQTRNV